ncbi:MAG: hypothetical protein WCJ64_21200 [Rhodospirillaceae bacterium]
MNKADLIAVSTDQNNAAFSMNGETALNTIMATLARGKPGFCLVALVR